MAQDDLVAIPRPVMVYYLDQDKKAKFLESQLHDLKSRIEIKTQENKNYVFQIEQYKADSTANANIIAANRAALTFKDEQYAQLEQYLDTVVKKKNGQIFVSTLIAILSLLAAIML
jgi:hypothetical protein